MIGDDRRCRTPGQGKLIVGPTSRALADDPVVGVVGFLSPLLAQPRPMTTAKPAAGMAKRASFTSGLLPWSRPRLGRPSMALNDIRFAFPAGAFPAAAGA